MLNLIHLSGEAFMFNKPLYLHTGVGPAQFFKKLSYWVVLSLVLCVFYTYKCTYDVI